MDTSTLRDDCCFRLNSDYLSGHFQPRLIELPEQELDAILAIKARFKDE
ncbi:hypothetical protein [Lacimicrobium alkaliphilum]|nr:hypothetical protein [Lacimicrobium alkaliphilum]